MRTKHSFISLLASVAIPFRLYAAEPTKEPTLVERLNAWLKDKEQLTADLSAATQRAATAEAALATAKTDATNAATLAAAALTEATAKVTAAEAKASESEGKITALNAQLSTLSSLLTSVGFSVTATVNGQPLDVTAFQTAWNAHIAAATTQKLAELGVKSDKLPAAAEGNGTETMEELHAQLAQATTAADKGRIAAKINALRDADWGKASGKN